MSGVWYGRCWFSSGVLREGRSASANLTGPHTSVGTPRIEPIGSHTQFPPHAHAVCDGAFPCGLPLSLLAFVPSPVLQRSTTRARPQHVLRAPRSRTDGFALRGLVPVGEFTSFGNLGKFPGIPFLWMGLLSKFPGISQYNRYCW